ncbi:hypothetical protein WSM22_38890 [Cytophagales bacterium WSM2-2]|nr:hypothetical protein WSM22_38890 [Cytophagales bacterium WSM2-2]
MIAASVIPFVLVFDYGLPDPNHPANGWDNFYREGFMAFVFVFLQLFFVLGSTLIMQIEVRNNAWKQVLASPQSFFHILSAKFVVVQLLALVFIVVFNVYMILCAAVLDVIYDLDYAAYMQRWPELINLNLMAYGSTMGISALGFWLALRFKNFVAPVAIGFLLWMIGPIVAIELKWPHMDMYVSAIPFTIVSKRFEHEHTLHQLVSIGYTVLFFGIAYLEFAMERIGLKSLLGIK